MTRIIGPIPRELDYAFWAKWLAGGMEAEMSLAAHRDHRQPDMIARLNAWQRQQREAATADAELAADLAEWGERPRW